MMSTLGWKFWGVAFVSWALYSSWYFGYQSGYADGHLTACNLYQSPILDVAGPSISDIASLETVPSPQGSDDGAISAIR